MMLLFWLKKFVAYWLMPLPFCVTVMLIGVLLWRSARWARFGRVLVVGALGLFVVLCNAYVGRALLRPLEVRYPALPEFSPTHPLPAEVRDLGYIMVLGGGNGRSPDTAATNLLSSAALARVVEAARIARAVPAAKIITSGGPPGPNNHAAVVARALRSLGIEADRIIEITDALDTEDESRRVQQIAAGAKVAVVTSAWHMPRSMALFRSAGLRPLACPADFQTHAEKDFYFDQILWNIEGLGLSSLAFRERIGFLWIWLRGKT